ncbi:MAG: ABC transporter permease [Candidatus Accumulibacter sp.]|nr:ABC transporter permease [Accumulibacter sp.]
MSAFSAVYFRELLILKHRLKRQVAGMAVSPLLYILTFGYALGGHLRIGENAYLDFLLPGLVAMSSMTQAFAISSDINISRFYFHTFEEIQAAPVGRFAYVFGEIAAGVTRVLIAALVILALGRLFGVTPHCGVFFWLAVVLNGFAFSALGIATALLVKTHADQSILSNFIITPMAFLGGTFFPLEGLPAWAQTLLSFLPLTHAARIIRADALGTPIAPASFLVLALACVAALTLAISVVDRAKD